MRDYRKLKVFVLADELAIAIYQFTKPFPREEQFGLTSQVRRAAVSVPSNIAEGSSRRTEADFLRFLELALGSLREVEYLVPLAHRLGYLPNPGHDILCARCLETSKVLAALMRAIRQ
jgi:four helix bundle protein